MDKATPDSVMALIDKSGLQRSCGQIGAAAKTFYEICAEVERLAAQSAPTEDAMWNQTLQERDTYHDWADKLAEGIAAHLGIEIGEHSAGMGSAESNNPWANALEAIQSAAQSAPQA